MSSAAESRRTESFGYGFKKKLGVSFAEAIERAKQALAAEGFGVLFEIDMKQKFREKLGVDYENYVILGVCNPGYAHEALKLEQDLGLLLPCNVVVYEAGGGVVVSSIDADRMMSVVENDALARVSVEVKAKLLHAIEGL